MSFFRPIAILLVFFGLLYLFHEPLRNAGPNLNEGVFQPLKAFFHTLSGATTTISNYSVLPKTTDNMYPKGLSTSTGTAISSTSIQSGLSSGSLVDNLPPVKSDSATHADSALSAKGIITLTNQARQQRGLSVLVHNKTLDNSAEAKLEDIFSGQYFEHVSPAGVSVTDIPLY